MLQSTELVKPLISHLGMVRMIEMVASEKAFKASTKFSVEDSVDDGIKSGI